MTTVQEQHLSGITFDWVRVRELRFVDNPESSEMAELTDLEISLTVEAKVGTDGSWCRTLLRVKVSPPTDQPEAFQTLMAAVEGSFSAHGEAVVEMESFSRLQGPAIVMPFVREAIARITTGSRFNQILLPPLNVAAIVEEMERQRASSTAEAK